MTDGSNEMDVSHGILENEPWILGLDIIYIYEERYQHLNVD